jgi:hypothetical protein
MDFFNIPKTVITLKKLLNISNGENGWDEIKK